MGRSYYYFAASLPMINWDGKLPMPVEEFLTMARRLLSEDDGGLIVQLLNGNGDDVDANNSTALAWIKFNRNLRNEIASLRAHRTHQDPLKSIRGSKENEPSLIGVVQEASKMKDLLEAEKLLDRTCWQFLDELSSGHYYDLDFLICYGLKLKILERHHEYKSPKGRAVFDEIRIMELPVGWDVLSR